MVSSMIKKIKNACPDAQVIAGNVCTPEGFQYLVEAGADAIKCGVGPGAACVRRRCRSCQGCGDLQAPVCF